MGNRESGGWMPARVLSAPRAVVVAREVHAQDPRAPFYRYEKLLDEFMDCGVHRALDALHNASHLREKAMDSCGYYSVLRESVDDQTDYCMVYKPRDADGNPVTLFVCFLVPVYTLHNADDHCPDVGELARLGGHAGQAVRELDSAGYAFAPFSVLQQQSARPAFSDHMIFQDLFIEVDGWDDIT